MKTVIRIALVLALFAVAAPAHAGQSMTPVQRIILQEQARQSRLGRFSPVAAQPVTGLSPVQRIIAQEQARRNDPRLFGTVAAAPAPGLSPVERIIVQEQARRNDPSLFGPAVASTPAVQIVETSGFHWGDAGIGAAAALGLIALATGTLLLLLQHARLRRT